jgi:cation diffusion facilitator CzcD-associated flavoprotein CzcO
MATDFDVLIIGAGISGICAAHHLTTRRPGTSFAVLEGRADLGGTWSLFRYPGIRSDSDMQTFGFGFKPWTDRHAISPGEKILDYLRETVAEGGIGPHIRYGHRVLGAEFCSATGAWTVTVQRAGSEAAEHLTARFLVLGTGYYDYAAGFTPDFPGLADFRGRVVHPQHWPADLDYSGRRIVVIGSGATAVTLVPSLAPDAAHVTMLQRSPGYLLSLPGEDPIAKVLNRVLGHERAYPIIRRKNVAAGRALFRASRRFPRLMRRLLIADVRRRLPKDFDVATHFTPRYNPWEERLCVAPDGDLFKALSSGRASVVTDRVARFTETGIELESGRHLDADLVVTATGLRLQAFGGIELAVDGRPVRLPETTVYKATMLSGVPNLAFVFGYTNLSWTLKADLAAEYFCRLLDHMDAHGHAVVEPVLDDPTLPRVPFLDLRAGYVQRGVAQFPRAGGHGPWTIDMAYEKDVQRLRHEPIEDPALRFRAAPQPGPASSTTIFTSPGGTEYAAV